MNAKRFDEHGFEGTMSTHTLMDIRLDELEEQGWKVIKVLRANPTFPAYELRRNEERTVLSFSDDGIHEDRKPMGTIYLTGQTIR